MGILVNTTIQDSDNGFYLDGSFRSTEYYVEPIRGNVGVISPVNGIGGKLNLELGSLSLVNAQGSDVTPADDQDKLVLLASYVKKKAKSAADIDPNHFFADATERDAFFPLNLDQLRTGMEIILEDDGSGTRVIQRWLGEDQPTSYPVDADDKWQDESTGTLTAEQVKLLYESNENTNALVDSKKDILALLTLVNGDILSQVSIVVPPASLGLGNFMIDSANHTLSAINTTNAKRALMIVQSHTEQGANPPFKYSFGQAAINDIQPIKNEVQPFTPISFASTPMVTGDYTLWRGTYVVPAEAGVCMFSVTAKDLDDNDVLVTQGEITFNQIDVDGENDVLLELSNPVLLENNEDLTVQLSGAKVKGTTVNSAFVPRYAPYEQIVTLKELVTADNVYESIRMNDEGSTLRELYIRSNGTVTSRIV